MMRPALGGLGMAILVVALPTPGDAQRSALREVHDRGSAGLNVMVGLPVGEFQNHVNVAGGIEAFGVVGGALALRLDGSLLVYDQVHGITYLDGYYYSFPVDMRTTSYIASFRAGPQLTFGDGPVRLYGFGLGGVSYFTTETAYGDCGCSTFASVTEYDDATLSWEAGGGLLVGLSRRRRPVLLDLGARYQYNGLVRYLPAGTAQPIEGEANLVIYHVGISVGLR